MNKISALIVRASLPFDSYNRKYYKISAQETKQVLTCLFSSFNTIVLHPYYSVVVILSPGVIVVYALDIT